MMNVLSQIRCPSFTFTTSPKPPSLGIPPHTEPPRPRPYWIILHSAFLHSAFSADKTARSRGKTAGGTAAFCYDQNLTFR